jgi:class 3 adenylate cyclase
VQTVSFSPRFVQALTLCRCAVYLAFAGLIALGAVRRGEPVSPLLIYFFVVPIVLHSVLPKVKKRALHVGLYIGEWILSFAVVLICGASIVVCLVVMVVFQACNTALWGWRMLPLLTGSGALTYLILLAAGVDVLIVQDVLVDGLAACLGFAFLLAICGVAHTQAQRLMSVGMALKTEQRALLRYLPKEVSVRHGSASETGVHRQWLTIAFVDLVGFTKATSELPAEALETLLNDFLGRVNEQVEQWDGSISKFLGDGVLCVFPSESVNGRGNAAVQAVRCLVQLPEILHALNDRWRTLGYVQQFAATVGVASGYCWSGDWGGNGRLDYTVIGVPVNLACRLQTEAGFRGGMLVDEVTAELIKGAVVVSPSVTVELKGMGPQQTFPISSQPLNGQPELTVGCRRLLC